MCVNFGVFLKVAVALPLVWLSAACGETSDTGAANLSSQTPEQSDSEAAIKGITNVMVDTGLTLNAAMESDISLDADSVAGLASTYNEASESMQNGLGIGPQGWQIIQSSCSYQKEINKVHIVTSGTQNISAQPGDLFFIHLTRNITHWELNVAMADVSGFSEGGYANEVYVCLLMTGERNVFNLKTDLNAVLEVKSSNQHAAQAFTYAALGNAKVKVVEYE